MREDRDSTQEREYARAWFGAVLTFSGGVQKELRHLRFVEGNKSKIL